MTEAMPDLDSAVMDDAPPSDEPERTRKPRSDKGQPRGPRGSGGTSRRSATSTKQIANDLLVPYATLAAGIGMTAPTLSAVMLTRGEKTVDAIVGLAAKNPRMLAALKKAATVGPIAEIAQTVLMMGVAAAMDFGRIPPEHPLGMAMGVSEIYVAVHPDMPEAPPMPARGFPPNSMPYVPPSNGVGFTGPPVTDASSQWTMPG